MDYLYSYVKRELTFADGTGDFVKENSGSDYYYMGKADGRRVYFKVTSDDTIYGVATSGATPVYVENTTTVDGTADISGTVSSLCTSISGSIDMVFASSVVVDLYGFESLGITQMVATTSTSVSSVINYHGGSFTFDTSNIDIGTGGGGTPVNTTVNIYGDVSASYIFVRVQGGNTTVNIYGDVSVEKMLSTGSIYDSDSITVNIYGDFSGTTFGSGTVNYYSNIGTEYIIDIIDDMPLTVLK